MPSTIVHLAFAGIIAAALLGEYFDKKALAVVFVVIVFPDLDSFFIFTDAGHRTVLHNIWIPVLGFVVLWLDLQRKESFVRERWGAWGVRVIWVTLVCYLLAHIALDLVDGAVNLFWPLYDQFYTMDGEIELSSQHGIVQTFTDGGLPLLEARGTTTEREITTGIDPGEGETERVFPIARNGWELVLLVGGIFITAVRLWQVESGSQRQ